LFRAGPPLEVIDWKFSRWAFDLEQYRPQLEFYALAGARLVGAIHAECRIGVVTEDGAIGWHEWSLDWEDLNRIAQDVRRGWERVRDARAARAAHEQANAAPWAPDVTEGPHCQYCDAALSCPAKRAAVGAVLGMDPGTLTPELAGAAWAKAKAAEEMIGRLKGFVRAMAEDGELPTGDGRAVRVDSRGALRVVRAA
jgi:hypothetical protein